MYVRQTNPNRSVKRVNNLRQWGRTNEEDFEEHRRTKWIIFKPREGLRRGRVKTETDWGSCRGRKAVAARQEPRLIILVNLLCTRSLFMYSIRHPLGGRSLLSFPPASLWLFRGIPLFPLFPSHLSLTLTLTLEELSACYLSLFNNPTVSSVPSFALEASFGCS